MTIQFSGIDVKWTVMLALLSCFRGQSSLHPFLKPSMETTS